MVVTIDLRDAELLQGRERHGEADGGAVRVGDDLALPAAGALLAGDELQVIGIDLGDEQRHIAFHAMVPGVGDDDVAGLGEGALDFRGDRGIHGGEEEARRIARLRLFDASRRRRVRRSSREAPRRGVAVLLAGRTVAGAEPREVEPWMTLQELDEMLAHHAGGAEDAYFDSRLHNCLTIC